jgi:hypothetical protein
MQNVFQYAADTGHVSTVRSPVSSSPAVLARGESAEEEARRNQEGLLTHAQLTRENPLIQQLYDNEYLLSPLLAGQETRLGNLTLHRLQWSFFQHEFRYANVKGIVSREHEFRYATVRIIEILHLEPTCRLPYIHGLCSSMVCTWRPLVEKFVSFSCKLGWAGR